MRVLYLITRAERGGGQVHVLDLLRGYADRYDCILATGESGFLCDMAEDLGIPVHRIPCLTQPLHPLKDAFAILSTMKLIWRLKPDVVHAHTSKAGLVARIAGSLAGVPVVYTVHMWSFTEGLSKWRHAICVPIERLCAGLSAKTITVSEANRQLGIKAGVGHPSTLTTVWNGVPDVPCRATPKAGGTVRIVMVARFAPPKEHCLLIKALARIDLPFEMLFVGSGPELAQAQELVTTLNLQTKVQFLLDRDDVAAILATAHIFVLASRWEGLPLSILEAMRAGLPVVATNIGGVSEAVSHRENGLLVPVGDEVSLRTALEELITRPLLRSRLGAFGRRRYEASFSYEAMLSKTQAIYDEVVPGLIPQETLDAKAA